MVVCLGAVGFGAVQSGLQNGAKTNGAKTNGANSSVGLTAPKITHCTLISPPSRDQPTVAPPSMDDSMDDSWSESCRNMYAYVSNTAGKKGAPLVWHCLTKAAHDVAMNAYSTYEKLEKAVGEISEMPREVAIQRGALEVIRNWKKAKHDAHTARLHYDQCAEALAAAVEEAEYEEAEVNDAAAKDAAMACMHQIKNQEFYRGLWMDAANEAASQAPRLSKGERRKLAILREQYMDSPVEKRLGKLEKKRREALEAEWDRRVRDDCIFRAGKRMQDKERKVDALHRKLLRDQEEIAALIKEKRREALKAGDRERKERLRDAKEKEKDTPKARKVAPGTEKLDAADRKQTLLNQQEAEQHRLLREKIEREKAEKKEPALSEPGLSHKPASAKWVEEPLDPAEKAKRKVEADARLERKREQQKKKTEAKELAEKQQSMNKKNIKLGDSIQRGDSGRPKRSASMRSSLTGIPSIPGIPENRIVVSTLKDFCPGIEIHTLVDDDAQSVKTADIPVPHTQHSKLRGVERGITNDRVQSTLKHGSVKPGNQDETHRHEPAFEGDPVVVTGKARNGANEEFSIITVRHA